MKQLNKIQSILFLIGGALMVIGAGCFAFMWQQQITCWIYLAGALMFTVMQSVQTYEGTDITLRRLKRIQAFANLLFVLAGLLMADNAYGFFRSMFTNVNDYLNVIYNKWVVLLLIAAILEVYTVHRIDHELSKKNLKE
jgi:phosphatidylglycerophosphate synthase